MQMVLASALRLAHQFQIIGPRWLRRTDDRRTIGHEAVLGHHAAGNQSLGATAWHPSITDYFPGGGWSTRYVARGGMPATIYRINLVHGLGPALQIAEGQTVELPAKTHRLLEERTNPTWPATWFAPRLTEQTPFGHTYSVMDNWGAIHGVMSYGHIGADLISLASVLRIPVYMHNVDRAHVFRPSTWAAFYAFGGLVVCGWRGFGSAGFRAVVGRGIGEGPISIGGGTTQEMSKIKI